VAWESAAGQSEVGGRGQGLSIRKSWTPIRRCGHFGDSSLLSSIRNLYILGTCSFSNRKSTTVLAVYAGFNYCNDTDNTDDRLTSANTLAM